MVLLVLDRIAERLEAELVGQLGKFSVELSQLGRNFALGFGGEVGAVDQLGAGQQFGQLFIADALVNLFDEVQILARGCP